jgi:hypothetical protein
MILSDPRETKAHAALLQDSAEETLTAIMNARAAMDRAGRKDKPLLVLAGRDARHTAQVVQSLLVLNKVADREPVALGIDLPQSHSTRALSATVKTLFQSADARGALSLAALTSVEYGCHSPAAYTTFFLNTLARAIPACLTGPNSPHPADNAETVQQAATFGRETGARVVYQLAAQVCVAGDVGMDVSPENSLLGQARALKHGALAIRQATEKFKFLDWALVRTRHPRAELHTLPPLPAVTSEWKAMPAFITTATGQLSPEGTRLMPLPDSTFRQQETEQQYVGSLLAACGARHHTEQETEVATAFCASLVRNFCETAARTGRMPEDWPKTERGIARALAFSVK